MASSGSLLLGPMTALGLVPLLRLTAGRVRPPSGHRYCSNSFFSTIERTGREDPNLIEFFLNFELLWIAICSRVKNPACVC